MMPALLPAASYVNLYGLLRQPLLSDLANPTVKPAELLLLDGTNPTVELVESLYCLGIRGIPFETRIYFLLLYRS